MWGISWLHQVLRAWFFFFFLSLLCLNQETASAEWIKAEQIEHLKKWVTPGSAWCVLLRNFLITDRQSPQRSLVKDQVLINLHLCPWAMLLSALVMSSLLINAFQKHQRNLGRIQGFMLFAVMTAVQVLYLFFIFFCTKDWSLFLKVRDIILVSLQHWWCENAQRRQAFKRSDFLISPCSISRSLLHIWAGDVAISREVTWHKWGWGRGRGERYF